MSSFFQNFAGFNARYLKGFFFMFWNSLNRQDLSDF